MIETCVWKAVPGTNGTYEATAEGQVRVVKTGRVCPTCTHPQGYLSVWVGKHYLLHQIIARTFLGEPAPRAQVNHMNGNKKDNRLCNLEYVTPSENAQHAVKTGLVPLRFSEQDIADIRRRRAEGATLTVLSRQFHVDRGYLSHICNGKRRKA